MNILKMFFMIVILMSSICLSGISQITDISKGEYIIYSVKDGKVVEPSVIVEDFANFDIMFYGEQHTDIITHNVQYLLLQMIYKSYGNKATLSMEMFDRDVQYILDEYLDEHIKESYFQKDARCWVNYNDYRPMIEFSKSHKLKVIAANAPFRYVNLVNKFGLDTLMLLSEQAKNAMAPLPYTIATGDYAEKLRNLGNDDSPKKKKKMKSMPTSDSTKTKKYDIIPGHSLWDATMAYSVFQCHNANPETKILHLNGSFHTEEYFGIIQRLKEFDANIKPLVVTSVAYGKKLSGIDFDKYKKLGNYIVFTKTKPE